MSFLEAIATEENFLEALEQERKQRELYDFLGSRCAKCGVLRLFGRCPLRGCVGGMVWAPAKMLFLDLAWISPGSRPGSMRILYFHVFP